MSVDLSSGPSLDAEIARQVFGLRVEWGDEECSSCTPGAKWVPGSEYWAVPTPYVYQSDDDEEGEYLPPYSTDIAAAWLVVEEMGEYGYSFHVHDDFRGEPITWVAAFIDYPKQRVWEVETLTAPESICRAALKALAHQEEEPQGE